MEFLIELLLNIFTVHTEYIIIGGLSFLAITLHFARSENKTLKTRNCTLMEENNGFKDRINNMKSAPPDKEVMSILGNIEDYIKSNIEDYKEQLAIANDDNKHALEIINLLERQKASLAMKLIRHESIQASDMAPAFGDIESATDQDGNKYTEVEYSSSKVKKFKHLEAEVWEEFLDLTYSMGKNSSIGMGTNYITFPDQK